MVLKYSLLVVNSGRLLEIKYNDFNAFSVPTAVETLCANLFKRLVE